MRMSKKTDIIMLNYQGFIQKMLFFAILNVTFTGCSDVVSPSVHRKVNHRASVGASNLWAFILKCISSFPILAGARALCVPDAGGVRHQTKRMKHGHLPC